MLELLAILGSFLVFPVCFALARPPWRLFLFPAPEWHEPLHVGAIEPGWTEEISSDGRFRYSRRQWVNDVLMELDARPPPMSAD